jgi:FkbM family methyltransferase
VTEPFVSYAQNGEDVVLARALRPDDHEGFYVDIGAGHPTVDSVTAAFSQRGWRGINVEPLVEEHAMLTAARPRDVNLNVAVGPVSGVVKLFEGPPENRGSSTTVPELAEGYRSLGQEFVSRDVRVRTLAQIADEHVTGAVDFLKVDVEGLEHDVLVSADWEWFRPRVIVVEATVPNSQVLSHHSWEPILTDAGYSFTLFDGLNRFYARDDCPELLEALAVPANHFDHYVVHPWVERIETAETRATELHHELDRVHAEAARISRHARMTESRALAGEGALAELGDALAAAQLRTASALDAQRDLVDRAAVLEAELAALTATRTFRHTAKARAAYARIRRVTRMLGL